MSDLTQILSQIESGNAVAAEKLLPLVYDELRRLAAARLAVEKSGQTLQPTALVHEAYLRMTGGRANLAFAGRDHFFAAAAQAMRRILVDYARRKGRRRHGGGREREELRPDLAAAPEPNEALIALDAALTELSKTDPLKARLVELRYFAGMTGEQAAEALGISPRTADRHWVFARAWLRRAMDADGFIE